MSKNVDISTTEKMKYSILSIMSPSCVILQISLLFYFLKWNNILRIVSTDIILEFYDMQNILRS